MKKKILIISFLCLFILFIAFAYTIAKKTDVLASQPQNPLNTPIEVPDKNVVMIQDAFDDTKPVVAMFYVDWCKYCRRYMPIFAEMAMEYKDDYTFALVNCENPENKDFVSEYSIMGYPSLFIIDKTNDFSFALSNSVTADNNIMRKELDKYLVLTKKLKK